MVKVIKYRNNDKVEILIFLWAFYMYKFKRKIHIVKISKIPNFTLSQTTIHFSVILGYWKIKWNFSILLDDIDSWNLLCSQRSFEIFLTRLLWDNHDYILEMWRRKKKGCVKKLLFLQNVFFKNRLFHTMNGQKSN